MNKMRILLDGEYVGDGIIEAEYETAKEIYGEDFDASRLTYDPDSLKNDADQRAVNFAAQMRNLIVDEPDSLRRDGWTMKGVLAVMIILRTNPDLFDQLFIPAVKNAFSAEAERRGQGETSDELMLESAQKMLGMLFATNLVEGNLRGLQKVIAEADPDDIEDILASAKAAAASDLSMLQSGSS